MANIFHAVNEYGPKLELKPPVELAELSEWIAGMTGLDKAETELALEKAGQAILHFCTQGRPVNIGNLGTFAPTISRIGEFTVEFTADLSLRNGINAEGAYQGPIVNKESVGWTNDQYKDAWDKDHIGDPLQA